MFKNFRKCNACGKIFADKMRYLVHLKLHRKIYCCHLCNKNFFKLENLRKHFSMLHDVKEENALYKCHLCKMMFKQERTLHRHIKLIHCIAVNDMLECKICSISTASVSTMQLHLKSHDDISGFQFNSVMKLECSLCNKFYLDVTSLKQHVEHHKEQLAELESKLDSYKEPVKSEFRTTSGVQLKCQICLKTFQTKNQLLKHKLLHWKSKSNESEKDTHKCHICWKVFSKRHNLIAHFKVHKLTDKTIKDVKGEKLESGNATKKLPYICPCGKGFTKWSRYSSHVFICSTENKNEVIETYNCKICFKKFESIKGLAIHEARHKKTNFTCNICFKQCKRKNAYIMHWHACLKRHDLMKNESNKQDVQSKNDLKLGRVTEDKNNMFDCKLCLNTFKSNRGFRRHMLRHKKYTEFNNGLKKMKFGKTFKCTFCKKTCSTKVGFFSHLLIHYEDISSNKYIKSTTKSKENSNVSKESTVEIIKGIVEKPNTNLDGANDLNEEKNFIEAYTLNKEKNSIEDDTLSEDQNFIEAYTLVEENNLIEDDVLQEDNNLSDVIILDGDNNFNENDHLNHEINAEEINDANSEIFSISSEDSEENYDQKITIVEHELLQEEQEEKNILACHECKITFEFKGQLIKHLIDDTCDDTIVKNVYFCSLCNFKCNSKISLTAHLHNHLANEIQNEINMMYFTS